MYSTLNGGLGTIAEMASKVSSPKDLPFAEARQLVDSADTILIVTHLRPDGDALGSALGLYHSLAAMGKRPPAVLCQDPAPEIYQFLPGAELVQTEPLPLEDWDLAIVCDMSQLNRCGPHENVARKASKKLLIDHHVPGEEFGDVRLVDADEAATAVLAYRWLKATGMPMPPETRQCLLTGIVTDTFSFKFSNTTPESLRVAAELVDMGTDIRLINEEVFETRSYVSVRLLGATLSTVETTEDGKIAWAVVPIDVFHALGANDGHTEGIINYVRSIRGVEAAFLIRQVAPDKVKASLRSNTADMAKVAGTFGGGGHVNAAGCTVGLAPEKAIAALIDEIRKWMAS